MLPGAQSGEQLIVAALNVRADRPAGKNLHVVRVVRDGIAAGRVVGVQSMITRQIKEQAGLGGMGVWGQKGGGDGRRVFEAVCDRRAVAKKIEAKTQVSETRREQRMASPPTG